MKKPIHGDEITLRYQGATVKATCSEVTEIPSRGPGAAKLTITSKTLFHNGSEAFLLERDNEMPLKVERVTNLPHKRIYIISFIGIFSGRSEAAPSLARPA
jgi:hypothetical protein